MGHVSSILIVEDDLTLSFLVAEMLTELPCIVHQVTTGAEALQHIAADALDLVILDWSLPDISGDALCRQIKASPHHAFLPVLILTGRCTLADRIAGFEAGADDYLTKPFHEAELLARVRALLRIRVAEVERIAVLEALERKHGELQAAYDQLRATQAQLVQTHKLNALGELVGGVAHELNSPLAVIIGNAELLPKFPHEQDRYAVDQIVAGALRAKRVVDSLLMFAQRGHIEERWYHPRDIVEWSLDLRRAALHSRDIHLEVTYESRLPSLWIDGSKLQHVLLNLLLNAEQFLETRPNPRIAIHVFTSPLPVTPPPLIPFPPHPPAPDTGDRAVVIDIGDNGPGLNEHIRERIFEPFVTTKPVGKGTGLSLAIAYGLILRHGGSMQVTSKPDCGTTFRIALPVDQRLVQHPLPERSDPATMTEHILVLDDDLATLDLARHLLSRTGYRVSVAPTGKIALQLLQEYPYQAILCDLELLDMDAWTFYAHLQALALPQQPRVVIMTGDPLSQQAEAFLQKNPMPLLTKPFTGQTLLDVLKPDT